MSKKQYMNRHGVKRNAALEDHVSTLHIRSFGGLET